MVTYNNRQHTICVCTGAHVPVRLQVIRMYIQVNFNFFNILFYLKQIIIVIITGYQTYVALQNTAPSTKMYTAFDDIMYTDINILIDNLFIFKCSYNLKATYGRFHNSVPIINGKFYQIIIFCIFNGIIFSIDFFYFLNNIIRC